MQDALMTTQAAADYWGLSVRTVQRMCRRRACDHRRIGGRYLIPPSVVESLGKVASKPRKRRPYLEAQEDDENLYQALADNIKASTQPPRVTSVTDDPRPSQPMSTIQRQRQEYQRLIGGSVTADESSYYRRKLDAIEEENRKAVEEPFRL